MSKEESEYLQTTCPISNISIGDLVKVTFTNFIDKTFLVKDYFLPYEMNNLLVVWVKLFDENSGLSKYDYVFTEFFYGLPFEIQKKFSNHVVNTGGDIKKHFMDFLSMVPYIETYCIETNELYAFTRQEISEIYKAE